MTTDNTNAATNGDQAEAKAEERKVITLPPRTSGAKAEEAKGTEKKPAKRTRNRAAKKKAPAKKAPAKKAPAKKEKAKAPRPDTKRRKVFDLMRKPNGALAAECTKATGFVGGWIVDLRALAADYGFTAVCFADPKNPRQVRYKLATEAEAKKLSNKVGYKIAS